MIRRLRKDESGAAALETLIVFIPWFVLTVLVLNMLFIIGSLMLNQSTVTRGAQQVAALGCLPASVAEEISDRASFGTEDVEVKAVYADTASTEQGDFNRGEYLSGGRLKEDADEAPFVALPACSEDAQQREAAPEGSFVFLQASYKQRVVLLDWLGIPASFDVTRNALAVSNSLDKEEGS